MTSNDVSYPGLAHWNWALPVYPSEQPPPSAPAFPQFQLQVRPGRGRWVDHGPPMSAYRREELRCGALGSEGRDFRFVPYTP